MNQTKPAAEYTSEERRQMLVSLTRSILAGMTPNCGRFSGMQIAYAKGRAWKQMRKAGF